MLILSIQVKNTGGRESKYTPIYQSMASTIKTNVLPEGGLRSHIAIIMSFVQGRTSKQQQEPQKREDRQVEQQIEEEQQQTPAEGDGGGEEEVKETREKPLVEFSNDMVGGDTMVLGVLVRGIDTYKDLSPVNYQNWIEDLRKLLTGGPAYIYEGSYFFILVVSVFYLHLFFRFFSLTFIMKG